ncbi:MULTISPECIES: hypothetical protein [unclassified Methylophaga]|jgi:hypothetical protein|uniref:hypothetical protein n=1 Tax=unclassified Methylophaga TaxID=2629249 RepID=UPI000C913526|nr:MULTISPECIES: hypothetical protein [unclassified Methylophaga]MAK65774.1 hypothetical protein [Methylophaga sp.]MAY16498.1 hypothetical protein [Methylophaga sp.]HAO24864.1 hypothetical protein [Methylophaga sp.]|tara:strand:+ start:40664 stop:41167 length:504 start_codon:yes stop_codon:yes gene_type:complete
MDLNLHDIHAESIELALDRARQYRSLLEPEIAESICLDILNIEPENQAALVVYILALTDQISISGSQSPFQDIEVAIAKLTSEYKQIYYTGIVLERRARFMLTQPMSRAFAYDYFIKALECYQQAEQMRPDHNDEAILRWNSCVRTIQREKLEPLSETDQIVMSRES